MRCPLCPAVQASDRTLCQIEETEEYAKDSQDSLELGDCTHEGLSLWEVDETDESLLPWGIELSSQDEFSNFIEKRAQEINEEFEDVFVLEHGQQKQANPYLPTIEKGSTKRREGLGGRPKVVQAQPEKGEGEAVAAQGQEPRKRESAKEGTPKRSLVYTN